MVKHEKIRLKRILKAHLMPEHKLRPLSEIQDERKEKALASFLATVPIKQGYYNTREIFMIYRDYKLWCETHCPNAPRYLREELTSKLYARIPMSKL